jgi:hypothetical protein
MNNGEINWMKHNAIIPVDNGKDLHERIVNRELAVVLGNIENEIKIPSDGSKDRTNEIIRCRFFDRR